MQKKTDKSLSDWLDYIGTLHTSSIDLGLSRILPLAEQLELRQFSCPVVVVGGTNGKGSVVRVLEAIYSAAGYRVAAYTSPHLIEFNERLQINAKNSANVDWERAFAVIEQVRETNALSFFEFVTLAALWICRQKNPDLMLLEIGLGGRLDAVNVVQSDVAVVTNVALDHMDWLGDTREKIAFEKAGIFDSTQKAVCGDPDPPQNLLKKSDYCYQRDYKLELSADSWEFYGIKHHYKSLPLPNLKPQNVSTALMVTELLDLPIEKSAVIEGVKIKLVGRYERYSGNPTVILDVAHNPQSCEYLAQRLAQEAVRGKRHAVVGMLADKNIAESLKNFIPLIDQWWVGGLEEFPRGASSGKLAIHLPTAAKLKTAIDIKTAFTEAMASAEREDSIIVFGSFHTVASAKKVLKERNFAVAN